MPPSSRSPLSSRDPSTRSIAVRLPPELASAVDAACAEMGVTPSELLRGLIQQWAYGSSTLAGPDAGYAQARSMASQLAHAALKEALSNIPQSHSEATEMLRGYFEGLAGARKRG